MQRWNEEDKRQVYAALKRRITQRKGLRKACFDKQLDFIDDDSKLKAVQCTRRAGKSYGGGIYLCDTCLAHPRATCLYIATTREQARRIMLKDVLSEINRTFNLGMKVNLTTLTVSFPNESLIYLMGLDSKPEEMQKAFGQKYYLVLIDEGGSWRQDQKELIYSVLQPACADYGGTIAIMGSPVNSTKTHFYDITGRDEADPGHPYGWSTHRWSWQDNPHVKKSMTEQIDRMIRANPLVVETPSFKQMYLNQWVIDLNALCYRFDYQRNSVNVLPKGNYSYALGLDLGFNDDTAITISAYSQYDPNMYIVEVFKQKQLTISGVAELLDRFRSRYNPYKWVVDGASKQAVEELKQRFGFPLVTAEKQGKYEMIQIMNNDFIGGRIKLLMPACEALEKEYSNLIWDEKTLKDPKLRIVENSACANHLADATLYSWRECYHYAATLENLPPKPNTDEALEAWWDKEALKALKVSKQSDWLQKEVGSQYGIN